MKTRKVIVEVICFVLLMFWFYEGMYKVAYLDKFGLYIRYAPLVRSIGGLLKYVIPFGEVILAVLLASKYRKSALYATIAILLIYVFWIIGMHLFSQSFLWPYHALWKSPTWIQKMLISLGLAWAAFFAVTLSNWRKTKNVVLNSLRNMPVNAS